MIAARRTAIDILRERVSLDPLYNPQKHDDLFLLRFLLSYELSPESTDVSRAANAVLKALKVRHERKLDEVADRVARNPARKWLDKRLRNGMSSALEVTLVQQDFNEPLFLCTRVMDVNFTRLLNEIGVEAYRQSASLMMECIFQRMDAATRRTGLLTKYTRILDAANATTSVVFNALRFSRIDAAHMREFQVLFPQLLGNVLILNAPAHVQFVYDALIKPLLPRRVIERTHMLRPLKSKQDAELLGKLVPLHALHTCFGGTGTEYYQPDPTESDPFVARVVASVLNEAQRRGWTSCERVQAADHAAHEAEIAVVNAGADGLLDLTSCQHSIHRRIFG